MSKAYTCVCGRQGRETISQRKQAKAKRGTVVVVVLISLFLLLLLLLLLPPLLPSLVLFSFARCHTFLSYAID